MTGTTNPMLRIGGAAAMRNPLTAVAAALGMALALNTAALADTTGNTQQNLPYVSGGVTVGEVEALRQQGSRYAFELVTAAKGSGAYIAAVQVQITQANGTPVLTTEMDGPYLLVDLQPGRYNVLATYGGQTERRVVQVAQGQRRQSVVYFDDPAQISQELRNTRAGNGPEALQAWAGSLGGVAAATAEAQRDETDTGNAGPSGDAAGRPAAGAAAPAATSGPAPVTQ